MKDGQLFAPSTSGRKERGHSRRLRPDIRKRNRHELFEKNQFQEFKFKRIF